MENSPVPLPVPTPRVVIDQGRLRANIRKMQDLASAAGVRLRPHTKTHKSPVIAREQLDAGAVGICCAKLGEAEVFADAGITDIRLPYPINPANADRVIALQNRTRLSLIVDDARVARQWSEVMTSANRQLDVLAKIDVGFHRCGLNPESPTIVDTIRDISRLPGLNFLGLLSHAGHAYGASSASELEDIAHVETLILGNLTSRLRDGGTTVGEISVGSTPTARFIPGQKGVTEMRPGNYVFFDRTQVALESAGLKDVALRILATVVSRPVPSRVVFDAGSKVLTSDGLRGFSSPGGHGLVFPSLTTDTPDPSIVIERLSEEHGVARVLPNCPLQPGDRVWIVPNHSCPVMNLADEALVLDSSGVFNRLPVAARGQSA